MTVGDLIRELRCAMGWSQGRLASKLCEAAQYATITRNDVSRWEHGKRHPGPFWLRHLAAVLQVPLEVLEGTDVRRRASLTNLAATVIAPIVAADLIEAGYAAALTGGHPELDADSGPGRPRDQVEPSSLALGRPRHRGNVRPAAKPCVAKDPRPSSRSPSPLHDGLARRSNYTR